MKGFWPLMLAALCACGSRARAHTEQKSPAHVQIAPRRDFLTVVVRGELSDLLDVLASDPHVVHSAPNAPHGKIALGDPAHDRQKAGLYAQIQLFLEQGGQILPLRAQTENGNAPCCHS